MLLTKIPFFKEVIIINFYCDHCGFKNNDCDFSGSLNPKGVKINFNVLKIEDLGRDVIRSKHCSIYIPELELEIPSSGKDKISTIEGFLQNFKEDLSGD